MRWTLTSVLVLACIMSGCGIAPRGEGDAVLAKIDADIKAKVDKVVEAKVAETIDTKILSSLETFEAKAEAKIAETIDAKFDAKIDTKIEATASAKVADKIGKVEAKFADAINNKLDQKFTEFKGKQNIGMFAGDAIYILILAIVVVLAVFAFGVYVIWNRGKRAVRYKAILCAMMSGVSSAKRKKANGTEEGVESVLTEIQKRAKKAGVDGELDRMLVEEGMF